MPLNNAFYCMQVNRHGSLCITAVFLYGYGHREKKRNLAQSPRKYTILTLRSKTFFWGGAQPPNPYSGGEGDTPSPHPHPTSLGASTRLGSRLRRSTLAPNFNYWIRLWREARLYLKPRSDLLLIQHYAFQVRKFHLVVTFLIILCIFWF